MGPRPAKDGGRGAQPPRYAPPTGPPPQQPTEYAPPAGPPPTQPPQYAPPPGPPPQDYAPPPGPPPQDQKPAPEHDWEAAVPDTSLFPPPPAFFSGWDRSPSSNAPEQEAARGAEWCAQHPLTPPVALDAAALRALEARDMQLMRPWGFTGELTRTGRGVWDLKTRRGAPDACVIGYPPLYAVTEHSPLATGRRHTAYYEVRMGAARGGALALGFTALPYPNFRLPGWHRGSMAVHGDDGHRFVNDTWGGASFTEPFREGGTYGVGMSFEAVDGKISVSCFFTRDGVLDGSWDLHEEQDEDVVLPVAGLEGFHDLSCAVGTYGGVVGEVVFAAERWRYRPEGM